jgi:hypothetical protein
MGVMQAALAWNQARNAEIGVRAGGGTRRADGRADKETLRVFGMAYGPGVVAPRIIPRRATVLDLGPTLLDVLGFDAAGPGLGRSLLQPEPTLPEWATAVGSNHNDELQDWGTDMAVRECAWLEHLAGHAASVAVAPAAAPSPAASSGGAGAVRGASAGGAAAVVAAVEPASKADLRGLGPCQCGNCGITTLTA